MFNVKELKGLSNEEVLNRVKPISTKLVPMLIKKGLLKENGSVSYISNNMHNIDVVYTVKGVDLWVECEGVKGREYVVGITDGGFNVVFLADDIMYGELKVVPKGEDTMKYSGDYTIVDDLG